MEKRSQNKVNPLYKVPSMDNWKGRNTDSSLGKQYWYQTINLIDDFDFYSKPDIVLIGYECDEGVKRNQGRIGAKEGPDKVRQSLGKIPIHFEELNIIDAGNVICLDNDLESSQKLFSEAIQKIINQGAFPIAIGGGHDIAFTHFNGIWNAVKNTEKKRIGIINFDAHFDLRPIVENGNSGTPFNQILSNTEVNKYVNYFPIGIQKQSNTKELFEIADKFGVNYIENFDCESSNINYVIRQLEPFLEKNDWIYITIDLDGFSSAFVSGVSAPSPLGFSPNFIFKVIDYLMNSDKVISCDIAELNPKYDTDEMTANLAAKLVDFIVMNR
ncbi:formimidoylglutamase [Urechidicola croceus]|uniref:Formimidoylglutamase n=1 Tax=Urechidicola croceus TaxID=1850246 RepID=A0A1D8P5G3_9FLAO|nr:formimidoylglutamase [Urechidicola croceus]AOW19804.1 formimidoylglutamase [Urechidicola croceus]